MAECRCEGIKDLLQLITCIAPPEGEYETEINLAQNMKIIVNRKGIFIRRAVTDDFLPFVHTIDKKVSRIETLKAYGVKDLTEILCKNIKNLDKAREKGSGYAQKLLEECESLIERLKEKYCLNVGA